MSNVHVARVGFLNVNAVGNVVNKNDKNTTIYEMATTNSEHRIIVDAGIPNTANNPTVKAYLELEASSNYVLQYMDQNTVVTYLRNGTGGYP